ncbi:MAG: D-sedoheptulose 7-phosphate isomerase [Bacteroidales bacterium]|jgi:D-sedoheptulose 7-phosphate isomerase|nr:D-sedoheptulose 7-phosphate isomerase [Bacteroidales bacterium]MEE1142959.1 D-sedoheptulose 7-phosphate isomerase [Bacteroidales bacterium]
MKIRNIIKESIGVKELILSDEKLISNIEKAAQIIVDCYRNKGKVLFCGNGGSAADAQHLAAELSGRFYYDRPALEAEALHVNTSYLTAVGNDYSFDQIYSRILSASGKTGDVLVGISTSGNSKNVLEAQKVAKQKGMKIISLTGESGGEMKNSTDCLINVPSKLTPRIQESHILIGHIICQIVEEELFPQK